MASNHEEWDRARKELVREVESLGFPGEFGDAIARGIGGPKAIERMTRHLRQAKPSTMEEVADEMLAIREEIDSWRRKKESERANARCNEVLRNGLDLQDRSRDVRRSFRSSGHGSSTMSSIFGWLCSSFQSAFWKDGRTQHRSALIDAVLKKISRSRQARTSSSFVADQSQLIASLSSPSSRSTTPS